MAKKKMRADQLVFELGLAESREKAKRLIMAGLVLMDVGGRDEPVSKPGQQVLGNTVITLREAERFVSRGAYKLLTAIEQWGIDPAGWVCLDVGASTGGFTDCMLQHGAAKVYAVDVGYGQLDARLREHPQVVNLERTNMRTAEADLIPEPVDFVMADVSFISLRKVIPPCLQFMKADARAVLLIKPQFEVGPGGTVKGVVRDDALRQSTVDSVIDFLVANCGFALLGVVPSKLKGPKGNQEYVAYFERTAKPLP